MQAKQELTQLKERLQKQISVLQSEMDTVDKAILLLERERGSSVGETKDMKLHDQRYSKLGLSHAIRAAVDSEFMTPSEVRDELRRGGFQVEDPAKLLGYCFATLKRLSEKGEFEQDRSGGRIRYRKVVAQATAA